MPFDGFISYSHAADGRLAPAVQRGLHRLAKPWHRRRALWIFRDQTGLAVTPGLWSSIQNALDGSEYFVLLAGADGAAWRDAALQVANRLDMRLVARRIGAGGDLVDVDGRWPSAYGVSSSGAVLVRPDGSICWRAEEHVEHPEQTLEAVLADLA